MKKSLLFDFQIQWNFSSHFFESNPRTITHLLVGLFSMILNEAKFWDWNNIPVDYQKDSS